MSVLWNKIQTYPNYSGFQFNETITTTPTKIGSDTSTNASFLGSSVIGTTLQSVSDSPPGAGGGLCWEIRGPTTSNGSNFGYIELNSAHFDTPTTNTLRANYVLGFWAKFPFATTDETFVLLQAQNWTTTGFQLSLGSNGKFQLRSAANGLSTITNIPVNAAGDPITANTWYYLAFHRSGNTYKFYVNGYLANTRSDLSATETDSLGSVQFRPPRFGSQNIASATNRYVRLSSLHYAPNETVAGGISPTAIGEIYTVGNTPSAINISQTALPMISTNSVFVNPSVVTTIGINILATPATASNAHFPEIVISTGTGVSFGTEPATANGEISYLSVSGNVNFEHSFFIATALMTEPTIVITFNDHTQITTSIPVSALMVNPFKVLAETNILINDGVLGTASADIGTHNAIGGSSISYPADEATATALFQEPAFVGQGDRSVNATVLTATALMTEATSAVNSSYFHEIKKINPSIYFNGTTTNYGSTPATIALDSNWTRQPDDAPLNYIFYNGNNNSYDYTGSSGGREQMLISGEDLTTLLNTTHTNKSWTMEYWYKSNAAGTNSWSDGDSQPNWWLFFGNVRLQTYSYYLAGTNPETFPNGFSIRVDVDTNTGTYGAQTGNLANVAPSFNWHHIVLTQDGSAVKLYLNGGLFLSFSAPGTVAPNDIESFIQFYPSTFEQNGFASLDEIAYYNYPISASTISDHYFYIKNFDPSKIFYAEPFVAAAEITQTNVIAVENKNIPATPITASILFVEPSIVTNINLSISATPLTASSNAVEPFFYGDPDVIINEPSMIATADIPPNIFRLDTAYYNYVQTNIAPFRYVTFDAPNSFLDWGSDNDFGGAAPFTYAGSILEPINGLNNNSLLSDGTSSATSGLIMKESEHDDNWGTLGKNWHTSFWIKKDITDTNPNGLRIVANLHSYENNKHLILYQYNNYIYLQLDDKVNNVETFQSSVTANVFDNVKHHIVISSKNDDKIQVYKNKILLIDASVDNHVVTTNSTTYLAPNTETNNRARFSVGALITPYAETNLITTPTASKLIIDEVHWAVTSINQTGVNNLYTAMPFRIDIEWFADPALSNFSQFVQPTFGVGAGINATPIQISNSQFINPSVSADFELIFNATPLQASANAVEPFSVIADNITNIVFNTEPFIVGATIQEAVVKITFPGATMYASAKIQYPYPYTDPYRILVLSQQYKQLTAEGFVDDVWVWRNTYTVGDLN
jgi:hypothetical protein